jgi:hypothetical protein
MLFGVDSSLNKNKYIMNTLKTIIFILLPFIVHAQSFPSDTKVLEDVKSYHGKIATAKVQNDWKLEKEAGYTFSNMAKRVVAATTVKEKGISKNIIGLAIYVRGGAGEKWNFSRYFVTSSEVDGAQKLTVDDLKQQTIDLIKKDIDKVFYNHKDVCWVYDISFESATPDRTDRTGDVIYNCHLEFDRMFNDSEGITLPNYPYEAGVMRYRVPAEAYVRLVDGQMRVAVVTWGYNQAIDKKMLNRKQFESLTSLTSQNFDQLFGKEGLKSADGNTQKSNNVQDDNKGTQTKEGDTKKKKLGLPKLKIKGF